MWRRREKVRDSELQGHLKNLSVKENNVKLVPKETQKESKDWIHLAQDKNNLRTLEKAKLNLRVA